MVGDRKLLPHKIALVFGSLALLVVADGAWSQGKLKVEIVSQIPRNSAVRSVAFSDGARVLSGSDDNAVKLWDTLTGALIHSDAVLSVGSSSDGGPRVLSGSYDVYQSCAMQRRESSSIPSRGIPIRSGRSPFRLTARVCFRATRTAR